MLERPHKSSASASPSLPTKVMARNLVLPSFRLFLMSSVKRWLLPVPGPATTTFLGCVEFTILVTSLVRSALWSIYAAHRGRGAKSLLAAPLGICFKMDMNRNFCRLIGDKFYGLSVLFRELNLCGLFHCFVGIEIYVFSWHLILFSSTTA